MLRDMLAVRARPSSVTQPAAGIRAWRRCPRFRFTETLLVPPMFAGAHAGARALLASGASRC